MIAELVATVLDLYEKYVEPIFSRLGANPQPELVEQAKEIIKPIFREMVAQAIGTGLSGVTLSYDFARPFLERMSIALREAGLTEVTT